MVQKLYRLIGDRLRIIERDEHSTLIVQQFNRMQIRGGYDRFSGAQGVSERTGNDLSLVSVRSDVDVGCPDQLDQFLRAYETVSKNDVGLNSEFFRQALQGLPIFIAVAAQDMRMSDSGNHVNNIAVAREDARQSVYNVFYALVR